MVTAMGRRENLIHGLTVGANEYIQKPFEIEELHAAIDRAITWRDELRRSGAQGEIHFEMKSDTQLLNDLNHMLSSLLLYTPLSEDQRTSSRRPCARWVSTRWNGVTASASSWSSR
jgi:DNA-binding response OmpR family regulator